MRAHITAGSMSGPMSSGSSNSWSGSVSNKAFQLAEQLRHGNSSAKINAARRLQRLAASRSQVRLLKYTSAGAFRGDTNYLECRDPVTCEPEGLSSCIGSSAVMQSQQQQV